MSAVELVKEPIIYERDAGVAIATLNRPEKRNALDATLMSALSGAIRQAEGDPEVRVVILTGRGASFCAGMDLRAYLDGFRPDVGAVDFPFRLARTKPLIAAINGPAIAGGLELALSCDLVLAAPSATFGLPEVRLGLVAAGGGMFRLPRRAGIGGLAMLLTGDPVDAREALRLGLINRVVPTDELLDEAVRLARRIASAAPIAVEATLRIARAADELPETRLWEMNPEAWAIANESSDANEGVAAFMERRSASWGQP
jgi:enoyl-CoA hydratase